MAIKVKNPFAFVPAGTSLEEILKMKVIRERFKGSDNKMHDTGWILYGDKLIHYNKDGRAMVKEVETSEPEERVE